MSLLIRNTATRPYGGCHRRTVHVPSVQRPYVTRTVATVPAAVQSSNNQDLGPDLDLPLRLDLVSADVVLEIER
jgi:hypothetical protein